MQNLLLETDRSDAAEFGAFRGHRVPLLYSTVEEEYRAATTGLAVIDRSWIGRVDVTGADRLDLLHRMSTNDLLKTKPGQAVGTVFTTDKGRILDYVHVLVRDSSLLLLTSPASESSLAAWINKYTIMEDLQLKVVTQSTAMFSLIGPHSVSYGESLTRRPLTPNSFIELDPFPFPAVVLYRREFHVDVVDVIVESANALVAWEHICTASRVSGPTKMGMRAYQLFRISKGIPEIGCELADVYNPYEAGLAHAISFTKGCYIGQEVIARLDTYKKVQKQLFGIVYSEEPVQAGAQVMSNGLEIGHITSASSDVVAGKRVALAILKKAGIHTDDHVSILSGGNSVSGAIAAVPMTA